MEWKAIETAPKDREVILAARYEKSGVWDIQIGAWLEYKSRWPYVGQYHPTHWQPLPDPPND